MIALISWKQKCWDRKCAGEKRGERKGEEDLGSLLGVEHVDNVDVEITLEPLAVVLGAVKNLEGGGVREDGPQQMHVVVQRNRVHHVILPACPL